jgi:hypothetical protein
MSQFIPREDLGFFDPPSQAITRNGDRCVDPLAEG